LRRLSAVEPRHVSFLLFFGRLLPPSPSIGSFPPFGWYCNNLLSYHLGFFRKPPLPPEPSSLLYALSIMLSRIYLFSRNDRDFPTTIRLPSILVFHITFTMGIFLVLVEQPHPFLTFPFAPSSLFFIINSLSTPHPPGPEPIVQSHRPAVPSPPLNTPPNSSFLRCLSDFSGGPRPAIF